MEIYDKKKLGFCPICYGKIEHFDSEIDDDKIYYDFKCTNCGASGYEEYNMEFERIVINEDN